MKIRKIQYNINYSHMLSFKDEYKKITAPYFGLDNVRYGIEQYNTIHENLRLIFSDYNTVMLFRKDGMTIVFEGEDSIFFSPHSLINEFLTMLNKMTLVESFTKIKKHDLLLYAVDTDTKILDSDYLKKPCPGEYIEFAAVYHYKWKKYDVNHTVGNYLQSDIEKYELTPFRIKENEDLYSAKAGKICEIRLIESLDTPNISKLKKIVSDAKLLINKF